MPDVLVRGVEKTVLERLKQNAQTNGRSLQAELQIVLNRAANKKVSDAQDTAKQIRESLLGREHSDSAEILREEREDR